MRIFYDAIIALPIGIIYNMIIHEFAEILNEKLNYKDKIQKNLLLIFGGGLIGFIIAYFFTQNNALKFGMYIGSILLLVHTIFYNWTTMHNDTRIIVMILSLCILIWFAFNQNSDKDKIKKNKDINNDIKNIDNIEDIDEIDDIGDIDDNDDIEYIDDNDEIMNSSHLLPDNLPRYEKYKI
jgi:hypothetical protein